jgi:N-acetylmuramoyl-L-alanine amidase
MSRVFLGLIMLMLAATAHSASVENIRVSQNDNMTRVVLDLDQALEYQSFTLTNPHRLVVDIKAAKVNKALIAPTFNSAVVDKIRHAQHDQTTYRLVFDLKQATDYEIQALAPEGQYSHRLLVDLKHGPATAVASNKPVQQTADKPAEKAQTPAPTQQADAEEPPQLVQTATAPQQTQMDSSVVRSRPVLPRRDIVIAIDPGHGGRDPGAIGRNGTREKDVVLAISRRLAKLVNDEPGMRAYMTRDRDEFITLRQRIQRAKQNGADMFISIHADAFQRTSAKGSSVYVLSPRGASSEAAQILADRENAADLAGGISLEDKDDLLASVLLDLSQTASLEASLEVGNSVLSGLKRVGPVHKKQVESAAFVVLKSPDIPSVLVETAFISNPEEERKLNDVNHQNKLAQAMLTGIRSYFQRNPITQQVKPQQHIVSRGDTLSTIAQRYRVNMTELKSTNNLQTSTLHVGDILKIP